MHPLEIEVPALQTASEVVVPISEPVTIIDLRESMCRWPIGDPAATEFHFCGRAPKSGSPYCEAHARKAYQPQQTRRDGKDIKGRMAG